MARHCSTVCLPFDQARYAEVVADPAAFRQALGRFFLAMPALFPEGFAQGYRLKESRTSRKLGLTLRRVRLKATGGTFTVRPSFALPYMAGWAEDASGPLFLRAFGVPFWAIARVFGRDHDYWYRLGGARAPPRFLVPAGGRARPQQRRRYHPAPGGRAQAPAGGRAPPAARRPEELHRHHRRGRLLPGS